MFIKLYDQVLLKTEEEACIVEILEQGKMYIADIDRKDGDIDTEFVKQEEIEKIIAD